jgi:dihydroorotate dehydrogenase (fumarate)
MPDLSTSYWTEAEEPAGVFRSDYSREIDKLRRLEEAGAGAIVLRSLFEEEIDLDAYELDQWLSPNEGFMEAQTYLPDLTYYNIGPEGYLEHIGKASKP